MQETIIDNFHACAVAHSRGHTCWLYLTVIAWWPIRAMTSVLLLPWATDRLLNLCLWKRPTVLSGSFFGFPSRNGKFLEPDKKKRVIVHCRLCKQELSYKGNTTNMLVHLQYNHKPEYKEATPTATGGAGLVTRQKHEQQPTITQPFQQLTPLPRESWRWKILNE